MPVVRYYDLNGTLIAQTTAASVSADGTTIQGSAPDLSQAETGSFAGMVYNVNASGGLDVAAVGSVNVIAPPGYVTFNYGTQVTSSGVWHLFGNWTYKDAWGNNYNLNATVCNPSGDPSGAPPYSWTGQDGYGNTWTVTAQPSVSIVLANGTTYNNLPLQAVASQPF
jgi:hypothetical protein